MGWLTLLTVNVVARSSTSGQNWARDHLSAVLSQGLLDSLVPSLPTSAQHTLRLLCMLDI